MLKVNILYHGRNDFTCYCRLQSKLDDDVQGGAAALADVSFQPALQSHHLSFFLCQTSFNLKFTFQLP